MPPNANNAGPSTPHHGGNPLNSSGGPNGAPAGAFAQQPGGFVPMFQPGQPGGPGGPGPQAAMGPYGVQVMMMPQGGMYTPSASRALAPLPDDAHLTLTPHPSAFSPAVPGYQGQPGQQMGGPPFVNGGQQGAGRGAPMGYYSMQQGQMQSPQSASCRVLLPCRTLCRPADPAIVSPPAATSGPRLPAAVHGRPAATALCRRPAGRPAARRQRRRRRRRGPALKALWSVYVLTRPETTYGCGGGGERREASGARGDGRAGWAEAPGIWASLCVRCRRVVAGDACRCALSSSS